MCYVGKATKIFFLLVAVVAVAGLILGLGLLHHSWAHKEVHPCHSNNACYPIFPDPIPANTAAAPTTTTTSNPTTTSSNPTTATTSTAFPPLLSPPSPISATLGPVHS